LVVAPAFRNVTTQKAPTRSAATLAVLLTVWLQTPASVPVAVTARAVVTREVIARVATAEIAKEATTNLRNRLIALDLLWATFTVIVFCSSFNTGTRNTERTRSTERTKGMKWEFVAMDYLRLTEHNSSAKVADFSNSDIGCTTDF